MTKNLNNDAYNFALEQNGQRRIKTNNRLTRENFGETDSKKIITDKQNYFAQKWLKYRVVVNEDILDLLKTQDKANCYLWTSADKSRAEYILKELNLYKYFNKVIYDDKNQVRIELTTLIKDDRDLFELKLVALAFFKLNPEELSEKEASQILRTNTVAIMFPFVRSQVSLLTTQPGMTPILLQPINIDALVQNIFNEEKSNN